MDVARVIRNLKIKKKKIVFWHKPWYTFTEIEVNSQNDDAHSDTGGPDPGVLCVGGGDQRQDGLPLRRPGQD